MTDLFPPPTLQTLDPKSPSANGERPRLIKRSVRTIPFGANSIDTNSTAKHTGTLNVPATLPLRFAQVVPPMESVNETFTLLEKWDGVVTAEDADTFTAHLSGATVASKLQAIFSKSELSREERGQIEVGGAFVWTIGYRHKGTTRHRDSVIYFRRLPPWGEDEIENGSRKAHDFGEIVGWK
jgi:hypothetical protein